jgi:uncharacterized protein YjbI with pentapeptide repeats
MDNKPDPENDKGGGSHRLLLWSGFGDKTLWDWLTLFFTAAIPIVVLFAGQRFSENQRSTELEVEQERQRQAALQAYLDDMTSLLLDRGLSSPDADKLVRDLARARTLTVLTGLDGVRKRDVIWFLYTTDLITFVDEGKEREPVISLGGADLSGIDLSDAYLLNVDFRSVDLQNANQRRTEFINVKLSLSDLRGADLSEAHFHQTDLLETCLANANLHVADLSNNSRIDSYLIGVDAEDPYIKLRGADLSWADLRGADLSEANLTGADLSHSTLSEVNFTGADLTGAYVIRAFMKEVDLTDATITDEQLSEALSLEKAVMPGGNVEAGTYEEIPEDWLYACEAFK